MAVANPRMEKVQNLPLLCVETILKFTPTFKLIRLCSNALPVPWTSWNLGLETVLEKRLPLSLGADRPYHHYQAEGPTAVFDAAGANVASVKHPEMFRFSPVLEFMENAFTPIPTALERSTHSEVLQFCVRDGEALLTNLPNVTALSLVCGGHARFEQKDLLASNLKHLLQQLESFVIKHPSDTWYVALANQTLCDFLRVMPMHEMSRLRRLHLPDEAFRCVIEQANSGNGSALPVLSGLNSLSIWQRGESLFDPDYADVLRFVSTYCRQVTVLSIFVCGEFKPFLDACSALTGLKALGMNLKKLSNIQMNGLTFDGSEAINSVSDLRVVCPWRSYDQDDTVIMFKISTFFPNVKTVAVQSGEYMNAYTLQLATFIFGQRQFFPAAAELGCFFPDEMVWWTSAELEEWLANPHLPEAVDLSQVIFEYLARDGGFLTAIFYSMQSNSVKRLLLRGPVHRDALSRLQDRIDLLGDNVKISAWKDRDFGDQRGILNLTEISEQTDFKILGTKDSGSLKGEQFTIRIFHQLAKRVAIFN